MPSTAFWKNSFSVVCTCYALYHRQWIYECPFYACSYFCFLTMAIAIVLNILRFPNRYMEYLPFSVRQAIDKVICRVEAIRREQRQLEAEKEANDQWDFSHRYLQNAPPPDFVKVRDSRINSDPRCAICWDSLDDPNHDETVIVCGHRFHTQCNSQMGGESIQNHQTEIPIRTSIYSFHEQTRQLSVSKL